MSSDTQKSTFVPMAIIAALFFIFGFVTWLNGSLIPFLKIACELNHIQAYLVTMVFYIAYTVMALPMSFILHKVGYKNGMMLGLIIIAVGSLIFIPAAQTRMYSVFLFALFVLGAGLTIIQTAVNPYVVHLGPRDTAAVRIAIMGILNKGAGVVAPLVFTALILSNMEQFTEARLASLDAVQRALELDALTSRLVTPYIVMAVVSLVLAAGIKLSPIPELDINEVDDNQAPDGNRMGVLQYPQLILGAIALFFYVGVEVIAGDTIGLYGQGMGVSNWGQLTSYTMILMVIGYVTGLIVIPRWISQAAALASTAGLGLAFTAFVMFSSTESSALSSILFGWMGVPTIPNTVLFVALLGFANAMVWPAIWPLALHNLGRHTATGSALLIMGISGGALFPFLYGLLAESSGNAQTAYWVMIPSYLFILFYALKGHKMTSWK